MGDRCSAALVGLVMAHVVLLAPAQLAAQAGGRVQLLRSTSGSRGTPDGARFVMEDPRTVFQAGKDRQVLVTFEWQGRTGPHHCEASWKEPSGRVVFTSQADVNARTARFGVYWGLSLPDTVATGNWVVEARVDGEPAGVHAFQIVSDPAAATATAQRVLSLAELYKVGLAHTLTVEALDAKGALLTRFSGFRVAKTLVATSFSAINAAHRVRLAGDPAAETSEIVSWNRRDDWAILRFAGLAGEAPPLAKEGGRVGDRCFFLDAREDGGRAIVETAVVGRTDAGDLLLGDSGGGASLGAPVLNEYGQVLAALVGNSISSEGAGEGAALPNRPLRYLRGTRGRPVPALPAEGSTARSLDDLLRDGVFVRPVVRTPHFISGVMATSVERQGPAQIPVARDQRFQFSRSDRQCVVFVTWTPNAKEDARSAFELYDDENRRLTASEERKLKLRSGQSFVQVWNVALAALKPAVYRVDVSKDGDPIWRTFFRVTD